MERVRLYDNEKLTLEDAEALQELTYQYTLDLLGGILGLSSGCLTKPTFTVTNNVVDIGAAIFYAPNADAVNALEVVRYDPALSEQLQEAVSIPQNTAFQYIWARVPEAEPNTVEENRKFWSPVHDGPLNKAVRTRIKQSVVFVVSPVKPTSPSTAHDWFSIATCLETTDSDGLPSYTIRPTYAWDIELPTSSDSTTLLSSTGKGDSYALLQNIVSDGAIAPTDEVFLVTEDVLGTIAATVPSPAPYPITDTYAPRRLFGMLETVRAELSRIRHGALYEYAYNALWSVPTVSWWNAGGTAFNLGSTGSYLSLKSLTAAIDAAEATYNTVNTGVLNFQSNMDTAILKLRRLLRVVPGVMTQYTYKFDDSLYTGFSRTSRVRMNLTKNEDLTSLQNDLEYGDGVTVVTAVEAASGYWQEFIWDKYTTPTEISTQTWIVSNPHVANEGGGGDESISRGAKVGSLSDWPNRRNVWTNYLAKYSSTVNAIINNPDYNTARNTIYPGAKPAHSENIFSEGGVTPSNSNKAVDDVAYLRRGNAYMSFWLPTWSVFCQPAENVSTNVSGANPVVAVGSTNQHIPDNHVPTFVVSVLGTTDSGGPGTADGESANSYWDAYVTVGNNDYRRYATEMSISEFWDQDLTGSFSSVQLAIRFRRTEVSGSALGWLLSNTRYKLG